MKCSERDPSVKKKIWRTRDVTYTRTLKIANPSIGVKHTVVEIILQKRLEALFRSHVLEPIVSHGVFGSQVFDA